MRGLTIREVALTNTEAVIINKGDMVEAEVTSNKETDGLNKKKRIKVFYWLKSILRKQGLVKGEESESLKTRERMRNK